MKKDEMKQEIEEFYKENQDLFVWFGIKHKMFFRWLDSFKTHPQMRKVHNYVFGSLSLDAAMQPAKQYWKARDIMTPEAWKTLKALDPQNETLKLLNNAGVLLKSKWKFRPARRRSSE